jgi:sarcosine oxidase subunit gamma
MPDRSFMQHWPTATSAILQRVAGGRTIVHLKSWLPRNGHTDKRIVLAEHELPAEVGATLAGAALRVLCIGPAEWLLIWGENTDASPCADIERHLESHGLAVTDVTNALVTWRVQGPFAREVLSKGCGLDLHPRAFPAGRCARTRFADVLVTLDCLDDSPTFELSAARSYEQYLHAWMMDAAAEFRPDAS